MSGFQAAVYQCLQPGHRRQPATLTATAPLLISVRELPWASACVGLAPGGGDEGDLVIYDEIY